MLIHVSTPNRNLYGQFRRIANFYFLIVAIISVMIDSPVSPLPNFLALFFVIFVTMIKQGYEDFLRHRADGAINRKLVTQVDAHSVNQIQSQKVQVGDILLVEDSDEYPPDIQLKSQRKCQYHD